MLGKIFYNLKQCHLHLASNLAVLM